MTILKQEFLDLLSVLEREGALCRELLSILKNEQAILRTQNLDKLLESNKEKETCLLRLRMCDESRQSIIKKLAKILAVAPESLDFHNLVKLSPNDLSGVIKNSIDDLKGLLVKIQTVNAENEQVVSFSLDHVQMCLSMFENLGFSEKTYQESGQMESVRRQGFIIDREV